MFTPMRWSAVVLFALLYVAAISGLLSFLTRANCLVSTVCTWQAGIITVVGLTAVSLILTHLLTKPLLGSIHRLTEVLRRAKAGDLEARLLLSHRSQISELVHVYNEMMAQISHQVTTLSEEREQLSTVLAYMADGVLIIDAEGQVQLLNPAAARLLDIKETAALGRSFAEVVRHYQLIELYQRCRAQSKEQTAAVEIGQKLFLQAIVTPFQEADVHGYLVILQDLTTVRRLETVRRDFVSNISHELRTPLASLRAVVETLQDGALEDLPAATRFLDHAQQEVDTLTQMVEELLQLSRIESGQTALQATKTVVSDLILPPVERLSTQAIRNEVQLIIDLPPHLPQVLADVDRIHQVMTNLLYNAIKFTPPQGKIIIRAELQAEPPEPEVIISIKDNGIGIPKNELPRIFERFYKLDRARTRGRGGTGLGLAIARHLVQAHNGRIWVESKEGKGSTFYFSLPVNHDSPTTQKQS